MADFRIKIGFLDHPKTQKLQRRLKLDGPWPLLRLFEFCAVEARRAHGDLSGMDNEDIAITAKWTGDASRLVQTMVDLGWFDGQPGEYRIHDFEEHNPWVGEQAVRSDQARKAANARWQNERNKPRHDNAPAVQEDDADALLPHMLLHMREHSLSDAGAMLNDARSNAPNLTRPNLTEPNQTPTPVLPSGVVGLVAATPSTLDTLGLEMHGMTAWGWPEMPPSARKRAEGYCPCPLAAIDAAKTQRDANRRKAGKDPSAYEPSDWAYLLGIAERQRAEAPSNGRTVPSKAEPRHPHNDHGETARRMKREHEEAAPLEEQAAALREIREQLERSTSLEC